MYVPYFSVAGFYVEYETAGANAQATPSNRTLHAVAARASGIETSWSLNYLAHPMYRGMNG
jgi:hypothetical protein